MADDTLPPGTTHQDIDDAFGSPDPDKWLVGLTLAVDVPAWANSRAEAITAAKDTIPDAWDTLDSDVEVARKQ